MVPESAVPLSSRLLRQFLNRMSAAAEQRAQKQRRKDQHTREADRPDQHVGTVVERTGVSITWTMIGLAC